MSSNQNYVVYKYTFPNGKIYVGMTGKSVYQRRWYGYAHNAPLADAIKKFGWENILCEVLKDGLTQEEAYEHEKEMIATLESTNPDKGYNISRGGKNTFEGLKHTDETKKKMSESGKGRIFSEEHRRRLSESLKGKYTGENSHLYGIVRSDEYRKKQRQAHRHESIPVAQIDDELNIVRIYESLHHAASSVGGTRDSIRRCMKMDGRKYKGFYWVDVKNIARYMDNVTVLMAIFSQLNIQGMPMWNDMANDARYALIEGKHGL